MVYSSLNTMVGKSLFPGLLPEICHMLIVADIQAMSKYMSSPNRFSLHKSGANSCRNIGCVLQTPYDGLSSWLEHHICQFHKIVPGTWPLNKWHVPWILDDVIKWKHFPRYWPYVRGIHRSPGNSPQKGQWRGALMFTLICVWINGCANNREAGDWRRCCAHYGVKVMNGDPARGCTIEVWGLIRIFIPHIIMNMISYPCWD